MKLCGMNSVFPLTCAGSEVCVCFAAHSFIIIIFPREYILNFIVMFSVRVTFNNSNLCKAGAHCTLI